MSNTGCVYIYNDVKDAISYLKAHKGDGNSGLSSDHIIHAIVMYDLYILLCYLNQLQSTARYLVVCYVAVLYR